jgi:DNA-binding NarL/FixJ family response regulator
VRELASERSGSQGERQEESLVPRSLTPRETEVLKLLAQGRTNYQIARCLGVGLSTVKKHVRYIITKLGVSDRTQAALKAVELGLLPSSRHQDGSKH